MHSIMGGLLDHWQARPPRHDLNIVDKNNCTYKTFIKIPLHQRFQILDQDSSFHFGFQVICVGFHLVLDPSHIFSRLYYDLGI